jgi:tetratricopeptide (TPR) repeat protein
MTAHISEGELALYALDRDLVRSERRAVIERHIGGCADCLATHDFFVAGDDDLADRDVWEPVVGSTTRDDVVRFGARIRAEDRAAEEILDEYLKNPASAAWETLTTRRMFLTGGVVRTLNARAHSVVEDDALVALIFADAAIRVSEALPDDLYPAGAVNQLRATAWKERANAMMFLGRFPAALDALDHADRYFQRTMNNQLGLSQVAIVRAGVYYEQQVYDRALELARQAEHGFALAGDEKRRMDAVYLRGSIFMEAGDPAQALALYQQTIEFGEQIDDPRIVARGWYVSGHAEVDRGNLDVATMYFSRALKVYRVIGPEPERVSADWGLARIVMKSGRFNDAIQRFRRVQAEFEARELVTDAALVGLDIAECLLALARYRPIVPLARHLFRTFKDAGMLTGALSAIAYLKEAAASQQLTTRDLDEIRRFLKRAERQPTLVFAPPPRPPDR